MFGSKKSYSIIFESINVCRFLLWKIVTYNFIIYNAHNKYKINQLRNIKWKLYLILILKQNWIKMVQNI